MKVEETFNKDHSLQEHENKCKNQPAGNIWKLRHQIPSLGVV